MSLVIFQSPRHIRNWLSFCDVASHSPGEIRRHHDLFSVPRSSPFSHPVTRPRRWCSHGICFLRTLGRPHRLSRLPSPCLSARPSASVVLCPVGPDLPEATQLLTGAGAGGGRGGEGVPSLHGAPLFKDATRLSFSLLFEAPLLCL